MARTPIVDTVRVYLADLLAAGNLPNVVEAIGVPFDLCGTRIGSRLGPAAVRLANLDKVFDDLDVEFAWGGDLRGCEQLEHTGSLRSFEPLMGCIAELRKRTEASLKIGYTPIVIGGDHAIAMGSISAGLNHFGEGMALLWIDAHADVNTPATSPSGNVHGMPVAALLGMPSGVSGDEDVEWRRLLACLGPTYLRMEHMAWFGLRDVDKPERELIRNSPQTIATTMHHLDRYGLLWELRRFDAWMRKSGATHLWISFDVDAMDPILAPGTGTSVTGGLSYREAHLVAEVLCELLTAKDCPYKLAGVDVVEINPLIDRNNETAKMAVEWVGSLFGKTILGER